MFFFFRGDTAGPLLDVDVFAIPAAFLHGAKMSFLCHSFYSIVLCQKSEDLPRQPRDDYRETSKRRTSLQDSSPTSTLRTAWCSSLAYRMVSPASHRSFRSVLETSRCSFLCRVLRHRHPRRRHPLQLRLRQIRRGPVSSSAASARSVLENECPDMDDVVLRGEKSIAICQDIPQNAVNVKLSPR